MTHHYGQTFLELIRAPFMEVNLIWGIVPLYFALLLNELTSTKANFRTAIQTGFSFLWASAQWFYFFAKSHGAPNIPAATASTRPINLFVTVVVFALGLVALYSGLRRRYPRYGAFLGHTRFSNYFMISIFPMQAHYLVWTWERLIAIVLFAAPIWLVLHFGLMPLRGGR
ncbi:MAG TPA: hypothetical protein VFE51_04095 [Verrucomicrobiae bacterium]|nr:hypothetical protein [Verrucomicrobiae bacterium]